MLNNKTISLFSLIISILLSSCSLSKGPVLKSSLWKTDKEGWVLRKEQNNNKPEKFFAIGTWHVPGYTFSTSPDSTTQLYETNSLLFNKKTAPFNMVFVTPGHQKEFMTNKTHILNPFSPILHTFLDNTSSLPKGIDKDYYRIQYLKEKVDSPEFEEYLDKEIKKILETLPNDKYIYSHIDEIALGGVSKWAVPPTVGAKINERVKKQDEDALVYVDLLGHARGSSYFFEQRYLKTHTSLPKDPPYELLSKEARDSKLPLLGFYETHDGSPLYDFKDGSYSYKNHDIETLKAIWFENTKLIAKGYKNNGDVFGINAFRDFYANPIIAGVTVDALRAGLGSEVPIWLYFDGNGYAKPTNETPKEYIQNVMSQIYTAIIHGATGILFWNDWSKTPEVFDVLLPELKVLNENLPIIKLKTVDRIINNDLHIMIKQNNKGERFIVASNSSKTDTLKINVPHVEKRELLPLEVYVSVIK